MDTSYLTQQVVTIIGQLHGFFDEIGVPSHERDKRESELFTALSETLNNQLKLVANEKHDLTEEAKHLIKTIRQMEASLDDAKHTHAYEVEAEDMKITYPLLDCIQGLKEKYNVVSKLHRERFEQVKKLVQALESYASHLEPAFLQIKLPPTSPNASIPPNFDLSPTYVESLDNEFTRVYDEYERRKAFVKSIGQEMVTLWAELGTAQAQTDSQVVELATTAPEQLGLHSSDLNRLKARRDKLVDEKRGRERRLKDVRGTIEDLWNRLGIEEPERKQFLSRHRGVGMSVLNDFESELDRLNELKRQNLHLFVEDARCRLQELWDSLYFSEEEMLDFTPAFSDVYSDALLSAHEAEIERLEALKEQRAPTLAMIDKHRSLIKDRSDLAASSQDASRLMLRGQKGEKRDPTRLLREEKMRKRIAKDLPKIEADLRKVLEAWEDEYGRPFLVHGERYLDELEANSRTAPPPRSKTPNALQSQPMRVQSAKVTASSQKGTVRGPPPRSKTPTAGFGTVSRNQAPSSVSTFSKSTIGRGSPSKIPARAPLSNLQHGGNSPERKGRSVMREDGMLGTSTMRPMMPPPPKMQNLFNTPTPSSVHGDADQRSASIVRHVDPEDVYDDRTESRMGQYSHSYQQHPRMNPQGYSTIRGNPYAQQQQQEQDHPQYAYNNERYRSAEPASSHYADHAERNPYSMSTSKSGSSLAGSRQISATSSTGTAATAQTGVTNTSGSENWETYTEGSDEPEQDATDAYYAKVRMAESRSRTKRATPEDGYDARTLEAPKRPRGIPGVGEMRVEVNGAGARVISGSECGWTDDLEETY
ncbi:hypothetical protein K402DRAFT_398686 [Aulographum hederae CBS 113979]|uniref:Microtubule associated protein n=1 Tax=Aulographum hederae CBS 113979 TaxID=1176131 RepID=A0A6G1GKG5_9PEZI|nr:hypothetical protein K402DRAFT_398686 [Aulographum hederae CBS 113979]